MLTKGTSHAWCASKNLVHLVDLVGVIKLVLPLSITEMMVEWMEIGWDWM